MRAVILIALLLCLTFIVPIAMAVQQFSQSTSKPFASESVFIPTFVTCSNSVQQLEPGSGGGGSGVI